MISSAQMLRSADVGGVLPYLNGVNGHFYSESRNAAAHPFSTVQPPRSSSSANSGQPASFRYLSSWCASHFAFDHSTNQLPLIRGKWCPVPAAKGGWRGSKKNPGLDTPIFCDGHRSGLAVLCAC